MVTTAGATRSTASAYERIGPVARAAPFGIVRGSVWPWVFPVWQETTKKQAATPNKFRFMTIDRHDGCQTRAIHQQPFAGLLNDGAPIEPGKAETLAQNLLPSARA